MRSRCDLLARRHGPTFLKSARAVKLNLEQVRRVDSINLEQARSQSTERIGTLHGKCMVSTQHPPRAARCAAAAHAQRHAYRRLPRRRGCARAAHPWKSRPRGRVGRRRAGSDAAARGGRRWRWWRYGRRWRWRWRRYGRRWRCRQQWRWQCGRAAAAQAEGRVGRLKSREGCRRHTQAGGGPCESPARPEVRSGLIKKGRRVIGEVGIRERKGRIRFADIPPNTDELYAARRGRPERGPEIKTRRPAPAGHPAGS